MKKLLAGLVLMVCSFTTFALDYKLVTDGNELKGLYSPSNMENANVYESGCSEARVMEATVYSVTPNILHIENVIFKGADGAYYDLWIKHFVNGLNKIDRQRLPYLFEPGGKFVIALKLCGSGGVESFIYTMLKDDQQADLETSRFIGGWLFERDEQEVSAGLLSRKNNEQDAIVMWVSCDLSDKELMVWFTVPGDKDFDQDIKSPIFFSIGSLMQIFDNWAPITQGLLIYDPDNTRFILKEIYASKTFRVGGTRADGRKYFYIFDVRGTEALSSTMDACGFKYY